MKRWMLGTVLTLAVAAGTGLGWNLGTHRAAQQASTTLAQGDAVDVGFAQFMTVHHNQAVLMSQMLLQNGASGLTELARGIQEQQLLEMGQMHGWLSLWNRPLLPTSRDMSWLLLGRGPPSEELNRYLLACKASPEGMPGLASATELSELRTSDGAERDQLFLQLMIRHHQGALPMARFAAANAASPAVRQLADQILFSQSGEIERMTRWMALNAPHAANHEAATVQLAAAQPRPGSDIQFPCQPRRTVSSAFPGCKRVHLDRPKRS